MWLSIAYTGEHNSYDDIDDPLNNDFMNSIKKKIKLPKLDGSNYPFDTKSKIKPKIKPISKQKYFGLQDHLKSNVIGQDQAIEIITSSLKRSQAGLSDNDRPLGVFLFAGSSGVGKTHLANTLHKYLFGNDYPMIRIDCGEYQHKHENQKLIGSPPGYVGHDEGGQLVNIVKQYPSAVILLDEVEKAHPDLWHTFLRVFESGVMNDAKGELVDFKNSIVIMTTNLGNNKITEYLLGSGTGFNQNIHYKTETRKIPERSIVEKNTTEAIKKHFKPEFLNRLDKIVIFNYLSQNDCETIAKLEMSIVAEKMKKKGFIFEYNASVIEGLVNQGIDTIKGARRLSQIRREQIESPLADTIIETVVPRGSIFNLYCENDTFKFDIKKPSKQLGLLK